jgi:uncharacterized protein YaaW (UPF0174 family)
METIDIKGDDALLDLLSGAPAEDLALLVDHLTDSGEGRLTLPIAIKELLLESRRRQRYTPVTLRIMIRELQQFGGNTVVNLARRSGVGYEEIVRDVLRHLGGVVDASISLDRLELATVSARLAQLWPALKDAEKQEYIAELKLASTSSATLSDLQTTVLAGGQPAAAIAQRLAQRAYRPNHVNAAIKGAGIGSFLGGLVPATLLGTGQDLAGAAYRVTVPCVMQVAYLRQRRAAVDSPTCPACGATIVGQVRFCGECGHDLRAVEATLADTSLKSVALALAANSHDDAELMIGAASGLPMLSVTPLARVHEADQLRPLDLGVGGIDRFAPLIQAIPSFAVGGEVAAHRYLKVIVNGPLSPAADGNGLRGFVRGPDGKFAEHGRFFEDDRLKNLVSGAAIFQIASIVVAQKHLADISRKLGEIQVGVARVEAFQRNERKSGINGTLHYLEQITPVVLAGNLSSSIRDELEASERTLCAVQDHILTDLNAIITDVETLKDPDTLGTNGLTKALQKRQADFEDLAEQWKLCLAARFIACRLVCCYPGERALVERRQQALNLLAQTVVGPEGLLKKFPQSVTARSKSMKALTDSNVEVAANRERLHLWDVVCLPVMESQSRATFDQLDGMLRENAQPVALVLEMQGDKVLRALAA